MPGPDPRWPNFFVAGAPKAGTTSLHRYLDQHPQVFMSPQKEAHFFTKTWEAHQDDPEALAEAQEAYLELFAPGVDAAVRGESTPGYFHWPGVPDRIRQRVPEARFLVSLRDPIERAHSDHSMLVRQGHEDRSFLEVVQDELSRPPGLREHVDKGVYDQHLQRYWNFFGPDRVLVVLFEDLRRDSLSVLEETAAFLGIDPAPMAEVDHGTVHNPGGQPKNALAQWLLTSEAVHRAARRVVPEPLRIWLGDHALVEKRKKPPLEPEAVALLREVYEPSVENLESMLERELPELRKTWDPSP